MSESPSDESVAPAGVAASGTEPLPEGRFVGREAFRGLVRLALMHAAADGWRQVVMSDADFASWPLGEREVVRSLEQWASRTRQMRFLARDFSPIRSLHPRLVGWRQTWSHIVDARVCTGPGADLLPSALWTEAWCLERIDTDRDVVIATRDPRARMALKERLDAYWERGQPGFPSTILGL